MFTVHHYNFGTIFEGIPTFDAAVAVCKKHCFEAEIYSVETRVAIWTPISGLRYIPQDAAEHALRYVQ